MKNKIFTIGIAGGTGCGKSSIIEEIEKAFPWETCVLRLDNYYKQHHDMPAEERAKINFDSPDALDIDLFVEHIKKLQKGESVECPVYDFKIHDRVDEVQEVKPNRILIIDGIHVLGVDEIRELLDTKIYVAVDADERILRRVKRDMETRGRTLDSIIKQYLETVKPMHEKYIGPSKSKADLIIPQGAFNKVAIKIVLDHMRNILYTR